MNDVQGASGALCGVLWQPAVALFAAALMAWHAFLCGNYVAAPVNLSVWFLYFHTLDCPDSTLVSVLSRTIGYFGHLPPLLLAISLIPFGIYLFISEYTPTGLAVAIAGPIIMNLSSHPGRFEAASSTKSMGRNASKRRHPKTTTKPSVDTPNTAAPSDAHRSPSTKNVAKPTSWWDDSLAFLHCLISLLLVSICGLVVLQLAFSMAVKSIVTSAVSVDDAHLFGPDSMWLETNITEVSVKAINMTAEEVVSPFEANITTSLPRTSTPVNIIPDFITTTFGTPCQAVPTPAPVAKSTWAPAASSTPMPTPEPTPSNIPEPEPEPEPEPVPEPEPEPEPQPEPAQRITPDDGLFPTFHLTFNHLIGQAKAAGAWWLNLETEGQYATVATACVVVWTLRKVLAWMAVGSAVIAACSYNSILLFPVFQYQGFNRDHSLILSVFACLYLTATTTFVLYGQLQWAQQELKSIKAKNSRRSAQQPIRTTQSDGSSSSTADHHQQQQLIDTLLRQAHPELDNEHVRMHVERLVKQQASKLLQDVQLHATIVNAVLLAAMHMDPANTPMHTAAAASQSVSQHMWYQLVIRTLAATCLREQQQQQQQPAHNSPTDAPADGSSTGQAGSSSSSSSDEARLNMRDAPGLLLLTNGDDATSDTSTDDDDDSNNGGLLADLDCIGEDDRIMGLHLCREFAKVWYGEYPKKKNKRGLSTAEKAVRDALKAAAQEAEQTEQQDGQPEQDAKPEQQASPDQDDTLGSPSAGDNVNDDNNVPEPADPTPTADEAEGEDQDSDHAEQDGDNNDTPPPPPAPPVKKGLGASRFAIEQQLEQQLEQQQQQPSAGGRVSHTSGGHDGGDKHTPLPTPQPKKGLGDSRFADKQQPSAGARSLSHTSGGSDNDTPLPVAPKPEKGLGGSRFAPEQQQQKQQPSAGGSVDSIVNHTSGGHDGGKATPLRVPKPEKGLGGSRFADPSCNYAAPFPAAPKPEEDGIWALRFAKQQQQPSTNRNNNNTSARANNHGGSQYRSHTPPAATAAAPSGPSRAPGIPPAPRVQPARQPSPGSGPAARRPDPNEWKQTAGSDQHHRSPAPTTTTNPNLGRHPSSGRQNQYQQDKSSHERLVATSKYRHDHLPDPTLHGAPDGRINSWYRTEDDRRRRRGEAPLVRPYKYPEDPEASYRTSSSVNKHKKGPSNKNGNKWHRGGQGRGGNGRKA